MGGPVRLLLASLACCRGLTLGIQTLEGVDQLRAGAQFAVESDAELLASRTSPHKPRNSTEQLLMVCNAYAYSKPLHVYNMRSQQRITGKEPLEYKECGDYRVWLREGDQLDFRTSGGKIEDDVKERETEHSVGIFRAWGLPKFTSSLLLVPHRQGSSMAISFESHIFRELQNTQLAVVDAYLGESAGHMRIVDAREDDNSTAPMAASLVSSRGRTEDLSYNSVIALNKGSYNIILTNSTGHEVSFATLKVERARQKFVVMRTGADDDLHNKVGNATELPQEVLLHEQTLKGTESSATAARPLLAATLAAAAALLLAPVRA